MISVSHSAVSGLPNKVHLTWPHMGVHYFSEKLSDGGLEPLLALRQAAWSHACLLWARLGGLGGQGLFAMALGLYLEAGRSVLNGVILSGAYPRGALTALLTWDEQNLSSPEWKAGKAVLAQHHEWVKVATDNLFQQLYTYLISFNHHTSKYFFFFRKWRFAEGTKRLDMSLYGNVLGCVYHLVLQNEKL